MFGVETLKGNVLCAICGKANGPEIYTKKDIPKDGFICDECISKRPINDPTSISVKVTHEDGRITEGWFKEAVSLHISCGLRDDIYGLTLDNRPIITLSVQKRRDQLKPTLVVTNHLEPTSGGESRSVGT